MNNNNDIVKELRSINNNLSWIGFILMMLLICTQFYSCMNYSFDKKITVSLDSDSLNSLKNK